MLFSFLPKLKRTTTKAERFLVTAFVTCIWLMHQSLLANSTELVFRQNEAAIPCGYDCIFYIQTNGFASNYPLAKDDDVAKKLSFVVYTQAEIDAVMASLISDKDTEISLLRMNVADLAEANDALTKRLEDLETRLTELGEN